MKRIDQGSRVIEASRDRIYHALVDRESLEKWLPPDGMRAEIIRFEPGSGGGFRMVLTYIDRSDNPGKSSESTDVTDVEYTKLVPEELVAYQVAFESEDPEFAGLMTMTWQLTATDDGTRVEVRAENVPSGISPQDHEQGIASSLANLAAHVEGDG